MRSIEEVNATPTSFSSFGPTWTGSTAQATFQGGQGGTHGVNDVKIKVYDGNNQEIDLIDIKKGHPIDQQYTLSNGLIFT